jgi:hypothetical protein
MVSDTDYKWKAFPLQLWSDLGSTAVAGHARRHGVDVATFQRQLGPPVTPELTGKAIVDLATDPITEHDYQLGGEGLTPIT